MSDRRKLSLSHGTGCKPVDEPILDQREAARHALEMKEVSRSAQPHPSPADTPNHGFKSTPRPDHPSSGAFDAEGHRPVLERSRKVR